MNDDPGEIEDVSWRSWALIGVFSVTLGALSWSTLEAPMIARPPRPNEESDVAGRLLAFLGFVGLFSFFGFLVAGMYLPVIADAERPIWGQALRARTAEVTGLVLGAVFGAGLHYVYYRRRVGRK